MGTESHLVHVVPGIQGLSVIHGILNVLFVVAQFFFKKYMYIYTFLLKTIHLLSDILILKLKLQ